MDNNKTKNNLSTSYLEEMCEEIEKLSASELEDMYNFLDELNKSSNFPEIMEENELLKKTVMDKLSTMKKQHCDIANYYAQMANNLNSNDKDYELKYSDYKIKYQEMVNRYNGISDKYNNVNDIIILASFPDKKTTFEDAIQEGYKLEQDAQKFRIKYLESMISSRKILITNFEKYPGSANAKNQIELYKKELEEFEKMLKDEIKLEVKKEKQTNKEKEISQENKEYLNKNDKNRDMPLPKQIKPNLKQNETAQAIQEYLAEKNKENVNTTEVKTKEEVNKTAQAIEEFKRENKLNQNIQKSSSPEFNIADTIAAVREKKRKIQENNTKINKTSSEKNPNNKKIKRKEVNNISYDVYLESIKKTIKFFKDTYKRICNETKTEEVTRKGKK